MDFDSLLELSNSLRELVTYAKAAKIYTIFSANGTVVIKTHATKEDLAKYCSECVQLALADPYGKYYLFVFYGVRWDVKKFPYRIETGADTIYLKDVTSQPDLSDAQDGSLGGVVSLRNLTVIRPVKIPNEPQALPDEEPNEEEDGGEDESDQ